MAACSIIVIVDIDGPFGKAQDWPTQIILASIGPVYVWEMII